LEGKGIMEKPRILVNISLSNKRVIKEEYLQLFQIDSGTQGFREKI